MKSTKKLLCSIVTTAFLSASCAMLSGTSETVIVPNEKMFPPSSIAKIERSICAIAVYYKVPSDVATVFKKRKEATLWRNFQDAWKMMMNLPQQDGYEYLVFIGAGILLQNDFVITATHLVSDSDKQLEQYDQIIYVIMKGDDTPRDAYVVAKTALRDDDMFYQDYALLKLTDPSGLSGITIAEHQPPVGTPIIHAGSVTGVVWFIRYGFLTEFHMFFRSTGTGTLHISKWTDFPFMCVYPGGPGDSGGGIFNADGELVGMMFCGLDIASTQYVFSNPLYVLKEFLKLAGYYDNL